MDERLVVSTGEVNDHPVRAGFECHPEHGVQLGVKELDLELLDVPAAEAGVGVVEETAALGQERCFLGAEDAMTFQPTLDIGDVRHLEPQRDGCQTNDAAIASCSGEP